MESLIVHPKKSEAINSH